MISNEQKNSHTDVIQNIPEPIVMPPQPQRPMSNMYPPLSIQDSMHVSAMPMQYNNWDMQFNTPGIDVQQTQMYMPPHQATQWSNMPLMQSGMSNMEYAHLWSPDEVNLFRRYIFSLLIIVMLSLEGYITHSSCQLLSKCHYWYL
jgi:hypothetical protein